MPKPAPRSRARGPYAKSAQIQAEIVERAMETFAVRGFSSSTLREIATAVGMTQQGMRHHFPSKDALLKAVLEQRDSAGISHYTAAELSATEVLRSVLEENLAKPGLMRLSMMLAAESINEDHPAHEFFRHHYAEARALFARLVKRGQDAGEFRNDISADRLAAMIISLFEGMQLQWLIDSDAEMHSVLDATLEMLAPLTRPRRKRSSS